MKLYIGLQIERLSLIEKTHKNSRNLWYWLCECSCGNFVEVISCHLTNKHTQSCGCLFIENLRKRTTSHGEAGRNKNSSACSTEYRAWYHMKARCENIKDKDYKHYGGRGITICEEWGLYENFLMDMGRRPYKTSLDRIDNNGNYEPKNCRWATQSQQVLNRRKIPKRIIQYDYEE